MALKVPPPPPIASKDPTFNRWLLELTSILNSNGGIDPTSVVGLVALTAQVATNTSNITTLQGQVSTNTSNITTLQGQVSTLQGQVSTLQGQVSALQARNQVYNGTSDPAAGLGVVGDWYANTSGAAGHRIFVKTGASTWTAFPF